MAPRVLTWVVASAVLLLTGRGPGAAALQQPGAAGDTPELPRIAIVVRDVERAARTLAAVVDVPVPPAQPVSGDLGRARAAQFRLTNITIDLLEPLGAAGNRYGEFLSGRGPGVHHLGLARDSAGAVAAADLRASMGLALEPTESSRGRVSGAVSAGPLKGSASFNRLPCVTHLGVAVRDLERARRAYAEALRVEPPPIREFATPATGTARLSIFNLRNISIELLQQAGDGRGPYADFLGSDVARPHHVGFHLRGAAGALGMAGQIDWLERHGGRVAIDGGGGFAYVDYRPDFGLFFEALTEESNSRVYPHPHPGETR
jgi:hypothetical protein